MIKQTNNLFEIQTRNTTYLFRVSATSHLESVYFGKKITVGEDFVPFGVKQAFAHGTSVVYDEKVAPNESLDDLPQEISTFGKGDFRSPSILVSSAKGPTLDLRFDSFVINNHSKPLKSLPTPRNDDGELVIVLKDDISKIAVELHYVVFEDSDVIARSIVVKNEGDESVSLKKVMSLQLDMPNKGFRLINLYGGWVCETNKVVQKIVPGKYVNDSLTGNSSNKRNPFFMLESNNASEDDGDVFAFNLVYSGNHHEMVELSTYGMVRVQSGINPVGFSYSLAKGEEFESPFAICSYSQFGRNGASHNMHKFVNEHIVAEKWSYKARPVLINNWEATYFKFSEAKLLAIAKEAKSVGLEMFVLDDGWFGTRDDDTQGLGDYSINKRKLPHGLNSLAKKIHKLGLQFGLWFEPESINGNSELFRTHPDWVIHCEGRAPSLGRHQMLLDLSKPEVVEYIVDSVSNILKSADINYVKWDMNRNMSDVAYDGQAHKYIVGLYSAMRRLTEQFPNILFEGCASGGNRFDLGILSYFPQIWASDDTDAYQRAIIQSGLYLGYPQSTISCHVSALTSHQMLRKISLDTRFNVASFGILGYELNLKELNNVDKKALKEQIDFYKKHREVFQFGTLYQRCEFACDGHMEFECKTDNDAVFGWINGLQSATPGVRVLKGWSFDPNAQYQVSVRPQEHNIKMFGGLINMILPVHLNPDGFLVGQVSEHKTMGAEKESYIVNGEVLTSGALRLFSEWTSTGYSDQVCILGDFGSRLYSITKK